MSAAVERLVSRYEDGKLSRRNLVQALSALVFTDPDGIIVQLQDENYCRDLGLEP